MELSAADVNYHIIRSKKRKKTLMLKIERDGKVVMHVPVHTTESEIERFFREKLKWLTNKLREREKCAFGDKKYFRTGDKFLYLGDYYPLHLQENPIGRSSIVLIRGVFLLNKPGEIRQRRELFVKWYKERAREIFVERVRFYSQRFNLLPEEIRISSAKTRYGSCSATNVVSFSFRLVMAPYRMIDYVIVHELAHIQIKNHSKSFWKLVEKIMPDYRERKSWLKDHGILLDI